MPFLESEKPAETGNPGLRVGLRLRELRLERGLTLQQVADSTGFALSFLSLLERDKVSINIDNLSRLARHYGVRMVSLFDNEPGEPVLIHDAASLAARAASVGPGSASFMLLSGRRSRHLEPIHIVIGPGGEDPEFRSHEGESLLVALEGAVEILDEAGNSVRVEAGGLAFYEGRTPRRIRNASAERGAAVVIATSPPNDRSDRVVDLEGGLIIQAEGGKREEKI